jgi:hypothetical protein
MNHHRLYISFSLCIFLASCGTFRSNRTREFVKLNDKNEITNNHYVGDAEINKSNNFPINVLHCDFFNLTLKKPDSITISYWAYNDTVVQWKEQTFKGRWKEKYFEIYFRRKMRFIPIIYSSANIDRIRIGKDKEGRLVVMHFQNNGGHFLFLAGGYAFEDPVLFKQPVDQDYLFPVILNGKWGFQNIANNIKITPQYEYVHAFRMGAAIIVLNGKYGLINTEGKMLVEPVYNKIEYLSRYGVSPAYNILLNKQHGMMDTLGNIKIPAIFDSLQNGLSEKFLILKNAKYGYASQDGVIIPPVYDSYFWFNLSQSEFPFAKKPMLAQVKREGTVYFVDEEGYEYDAKAQKGLFNILQYTPDKTSKRKIISDN